MRRVHTFLALAAAIALGASAAGQNPAGVGASGASKPREPRPSSRGTVPAGVVVVAVGKGSAGERAGVHEGDLLLSWTRLAKPPANAEGATGTFDTPFDLDEVESEQAPRGAVSLSLEREGARQVVVLPPGAWGLGVRPHFSGADLAEWTRGKGLLDSKEEASRTAGLAGWRNLAGRLPGGAAACLSLRLRIADELRRSGRGEEADEVALCVFEEAGRAGEVGAQAAALLQEARGYRAEHQDAKADDLLQRLVTLRENTAPESLALAAALNARGRLAMGRGDLAAQEDLFGRSLAIRERRAPESLAVAESQHNLGLVARQRGNWAGAEQHFRRALEIYRELTPESAEAADSLNGLGGVARERGDLHAAEDLLREALALSERVDPDGRSVAVSLNSLGNVCTRRGDLSAAEAHYLGALRIIARLFPESLNQATILSNLGELCRLRRDLDAAREYLLKALALTEKLAPESLDVGAALNNLGNVELEREALGEAEGYYRRSLAIARKVAPGSLDEAQSLNNLGLVLEALGDRPGAGEAYRGALAIKEKQAPEGFDVATTLQNLAALAADGGDPAGAVPLAERARGLYARLAPGSRYEAENYHLLAGAVRDTGEYGRAADLYCEALRALEAQRGRLGGSEETRARFTTQFADLYREYIDLLLELGRAEEAYHIIERSRAQELLSLLAERDLVLLEDLPAELARQRREADADYDRAQADRGGLSATDSAAIEGAEEAMREIRRRQEEVRAKIRAASPKLASLVDPEPLTLEGARRLLDPGTVLLAYSTGRQGARLFIAGPGPRDFEVAKVPVTREDLQQRVRLFRAAIARSGHGGDPSGTEALRKAASGLTKLLLAPAAKRIASARRVLVVPDGPLHLLPFCALADPTSTKFRWLVEAKPVHSVVSMTVYAELVGGRHAGAGQEKLVAFGDPVYPAGEARLVHGVRLEPLPATRAEVESLRALAPSRTTAYLGEEATEARARHLDPDARVVHFACHGIADEDIPLDSALALTPPERAPNAPTDGDAGNGLLQVWEIFEDIRLEADLVTLSACETATGKEMGGEGLVGLARAFEYAGARSVLASLWSIGDESTARLMEGFYRRYLRGTPKDEALRQAQAEMLATPFSSPFHWAAFELIGDWH